MKKIIITILVLISMLNLYTFADAVEIYTFPGDNVVFNFSFNSSADVITSDFLIKPTGITLLQLRFKSTTADYTARLKVVNKTTGQVIHNDIANFLTIEDASLIDYPSEFVIYPAELTMGHEYYVEVSSPNIENAKGEIEISGDMHKLSTLAKLRNLGIAVDVGQNPYQTITRGEMSRIISQCLKMENVNSHTSFTDVSQDHLYYNNIGTMQQMGIADGYGNGLFMPDNEISFYESVKMIVCMLGYNETAQTDGYPTGYLKTANELGIILYPGAEDRSITLNDLSEMLYKALDVPLMEQISFGKDKEFVICDGIKAELKTVKTKYLGIK